MRLVETQDEFLKWVEAKGYSPATVRLRRLYLREFVAFLKNRSVETVEEVTRSLVDEYREWVTNRGHVNTGRKLSLRTVAHHLETLKMFFAFLMGRKTLLINPAAHLEWKNPGNALPRNIPTEKEMELILAQADLGTFSGLRDRAILEVMYSTGIRRAELTGLDMYDVNLAERTLTVRCGKGGKGRTLPLVKTAVDFLARYMNEARPNLLRHFGAEPPGAREAALFVAPGGKRLSSGRLGALVGRYVRAVKPEANMECHIIRHAFATHMLNGGADLAVIQRLLGHADISTTEIYTRVKPVDLKREHRKRHPRGGLRPEEGQ
jgi:integrase/recombinase XerD